MALIKLEQDLLRLMEAYMAHPGDHLTVFSDKLSFPTYTRTQKLVERTDEVVFPRYGLRLYLDCKEVTYE